MSMVRRFELLNNEETADTPLTEQGLEQYITWRHQLAASKAVR